MNPVAKLFGFLDIETPPPGEVVTAPWVESYYKGVQKELDEVERLMRRIAARLSMLREWHWRGRFDSVRMEDLSEAEQDLKCWYEGLMKRAADTAAGVWMAGGPQEFNDGGGI